MVLRIVGGGVQIGARRGGAVCTPPPRYGTGPYPPTEESYALKQPESQKKHKNNAINNENLC